MKSIEDLSKDELLSIIAGLEPNIFKKKPACCLCCNEANTKYWYVCDKCAERIRGV